jgi:hypothetical protein
MREAGEVSNTTGRTYLKEIERLKEFKLDIEFLLYQTQQYRFEVITRHRQKRRVLTSLHSE